MGLSGLSVEKLAEKARELNDHIRRLEGDKYDLEQRFKRQQYDVSLTTLTHIQLPITLSLSCQSMLPSSCMSVVYMSSKLSKVKGPFDDLDVLDYWC